ncbi:MAG: sodium ion-translocating decarboxylase subunit beta [Candidatus Alcyoniella australis]|nr:sodium ion-translocating decarboxylase subunit beta [Candidatus Alcyoniella australis]
MLEFIQSTGIYQLDWRSLTMIVIGLVFIGLAIIKRFEPLLLIPIGFGIIIANIPFSAADINDPHSTMYYLYMGVEMEIYPPLIFLGIGAMTDFSFLLSKPRLILLGAAAQIGIFSTFWIAGSLDFTLKQAAAIGIIGGADGPTAIYTTSILAPDLLAPISLAAYSYMALVPIIQPPIMRLLTTRAERRIRMAAPRDVGRAERIAFPLVGTLVTVLIVPKAAVLLGMLFFGNLLKESGVTDRLSNTAKGSFIDAVTILLGVSVGASAKGATFLSSQSIKIFLLGVCAFAVASAGGVLFAKLMNLVSREKINPLIGSAGVSAVPMAARVSQMVAQSESPDNFILMHAMGPNVAGVIGSAVAAGVLLSFFA